MGDTNDKPASARARADNHRHYIEADGYTGPAVYPDGEDPSPFRVIEKLIDAVLNIPDGFVVEVRPAPRDGETARDADSVTVSRDDFCAKALRWHRLCSERRDTRATGQAWLDALDALMTYDAATRARGGGK